MTAIVTVDAVAIVTTNKKAKKNRASALFFFCAKEKCFLVFQIDDVEGIVL